MKDYLKLKVGYCVLCLQGEQSKSGSSMHVIQACRLRMCQRQGLTSACPFHAQDLVVRAGCNLTHLYAHPCSSALASLAITT